MDSVETIIGFRIYTSRKTMNKHTFFIIHIQKNSIHQIFKERRFVKSFQLSMIQLFIQSYQERCKQMEISMLTVNIRVAYSTPKVEDNFNRLMYVLVMGKIS